MPTPAPKTRTTTLRFTEEDRALLDILTAKEDRSTGAILRLALRAYAAAQGVTVEPTPKAKRKTALPPQKGRTARGLIPSRSVPRQPTRYSENNRGTLEI